MEILTVLQQGSHVCIDFTQITPFEREHMQAGILLNDNMRESAENLPKI